MSSFIDLLKGRTQKYIKRIPKAGGGYRYVYKEHHKGGVGAQEHMKEGAAFKLTFGGQEGHFHIVKAQGDKITVKHDELHGPDHKGVEMTKAELSELLTREHKPALEADAKKKRERVERMKRETPRHIGLKRAERLAKEAEARLGEERPDNFETMPEGEALAQEIKRLETALEEQPPAEDARATPKNAPYQHLSPTQRLAIDRGYLLRPQTEEERALLAELKYVREHQTDPSPALRNLIFEEYSRAFPDFGGKTAFSQIFEQGMSYEPYTLKHTQASRTDIDEKKLTSHIRDKLRYHGAANRAGSAAVTYIDQMRKVELYAADALEFSSTDKQRAAVNELVQQARQKALKYIDDFSEGRPLSRARADLSKLEENIKKDLDITRKLRALRDKHIKETKRALTKLKTAEKKQPTTPTPAPDNFETMPEGERIANKAREAIERVKAHINELRDQQSMGLSEDEALEIDEQILDAQLTLRKLEREELKARRAAAKEQAPKAQPIEPPKPEPVKVAPAPAPEPVKAAPAPEPAYAHAQNTRRIVDRALSSKPTGVDLNSARAVLPNIGDLKLMLSEKERLKRAKRELVTEFNRPNFLGQFNPDGDIDRALDHYLNGPYVEIEQKRLRDIEKGFKIALRDARGEELEQVKEEIRRFWREWGGAYVRLHSELVTERTQDEALRKIRPLIQEGALTPKINQMLDQLEQVLDQRPVTSNDAARWIFFQETNKATRDNPKQTFREHLAEATGLTQISDLPPKGERTAEDARRFYGEPRRYEQKDGSKTLKRVKYERDGFAIQGPASGRGKGKFAVTLNYTQDQLRETRAYTEPSSQVLGVFDTLDEALTAAINQHETRLEQIQRLLRGVRQQQDARNRRTLGQQAKPQEQTPREQLIETAREATAPAPEPVQEQQPAPDNFETMPKDEFLEHPQVKGIIGGERGEVFRALNAAPREITVRLNQIVLDNYKEHKTTGFPEDTTVAILQAYKHPAEMAAKDKKLKERQDALAGLDERLPLAGIKASDLSLADAQASYRGVSWSGKERGEQELLEFKDILDRLEETGRQYIEAGAHEGDISSLISYHAQKILDAKRAQIAARGRTMSAMITGRGNFPVRSQKKKMDTYDKRLSEFVAAVDKAKKQLKKLDPNSRHAQRIEQGSGVDAYQAKLDKLVALQAEYKKLRAKARKEGKEPELVIPQYLLTNNNAQIRRVREQIENEKQREQQLDTADKLKDYTMPDGNELQVNRDQKDNRLKLHFWEKPDSDTIAKLKRSGYKWSRYNEVWQRQLTTNALKELPSLLNNLGAVEAIEEADA